MDEIGLTQENKSKSILLDVDDYYKVSSKHKLLTEDEERELAQAAESGNQNAVLKLFNRNQRLVHWVANKYRFALANQNTLEYEDLVQAGCEGLLRAISDYDWRIARFTTYAVGWIGQKIQREIDDNIRTIRIPVHMLEKMRKYKKVSKLYSGSDNDMSIIAKEAGLDTQTIIVIEELLLQQRVQSIDKPINNDNNRGSMIDLIEDNSITSIDVDIDAQSLCNEISIMLQSSSLTEREIDVITMRFGLLGNHSFTLAEVGEKYGITRERTRQIQWTAFEKLEKNPMCSLSFKKYIGDKVYLQRENKKRYHVTSNSQHTSVQEREYDLGIAIKQQYDRNFQPLDYQVECLYSLEECREDKEKRALVLMASGLGKTVVSAFDVANFLESHSPEARVLFLCDQNHVIEQAHETFIKILGLEKEKFGFFANRGKKSNVQFLFATFQTIKLYLEYFGRDRFDYIIVDEAHHVEAETFKKVIDYFEPDFLLGLTATPKRADRKEIYPNFDENVVFDLRLEEAMARGLLANVHYKIMIDEIVNLGQIDLEERITLKELNSRIFLPKRDEEIIAIMERKIKDGEIKVPKVMIFTQSVKHAERLNKKFPFIVPIHSQLREKEKREREENFRSGKINTVVTVNQYNEGVDFPDVNVLVFWRVTESYRIFCQQLGRGLRRFPGKDQVLVLDFVANCERIRVVNDLSRRIDEVKQSMGLFVSSESKNRMGELVINGGNFEFTEEVRNILDVLDRINKTFYPTWQTASRAAIDLGIESMRDYRKRYKEDPRLPSLPDAVYNDFPGFYVFLDHFYDNLSDATKAVQALGITSANDYYERYKEDKKLNSAPDRYYKDWISWEVFLGKTKPDFYPTWIEASYSVKSLEIKNRREYPTKKNLDSRLPSTPQKFYEDFPGWRIFLGTDFYPTWQEAGMSAVKCGVTNSHNYKDIYMCDPKLPSSPHHTYANWPGWKSFLDFKNGNSAKDLSIFEKKVDISFSNKNLLKQAFTRRSNDTLDSNYERLEFLGDSIIQGIITKFLYEQFPDCQEGKLSGYRSTIVSSKVFANIAQEIEMHLYLQNPDHSVNILDTHGILADLFEAFVGALHIDQGSIVAEKFVSQYLFPGALKIVNEGTWKNAKSRLQEKFQKNLGALPVYEVVYESKESNNKEFIIEVSFDGSVFGKGSGKSKHIAEMQAAENALQYKNWN